jgi:hypothetical protein
LAADTAARFLGAREFARAVGAQAT